MRWNQLADDLPRATALADILCGAASADGYVAADELVEPGSQRVRFVRLGPYSLDVEIFAFLRVPDYAAYLARQESILMRVMQLVADAGTGFAFPSQTLYLNRGGS